VNSKHCHHEEERRHHEILKEQNRKIVRPAVVPSLLASASTGITIAVEDKARANPSTAAEVGGSFRQKVRAASAAAEPNTCRAPSRRRAADDRQTLPR